MGLEEERREREEGKGGGKGMGVFWYWEVRKRMCNGGWGLEWGVTLREGKGEGGVRGPFALCISKEAVNGYPSQDWV